MMDVKRFLFTLFVSMLALSTATSVSAQVEFSGFFDVCYTDSQEESGGNFNYGQFEVDLSVPLTEYISAEGALAYEEGVVGLGAGFIDFHIFGSEEGHRVRGEFLTHSGVIVGQFDVPFGIDYLVIPSIDRKLVTPPLVNQMTIDSWNDWGIQLYGASKQANYVLFGVNGWHDGQAIGGRLGIILVEEVEFGGSYAFDMNTDGDVESTVLGMDAQASWKSLSVKGEYVMAEDEKTADESKEHSGFYAQGMYDFEEATGAPVFAVARYGIYEEVDEGGNPIQDLNRLTLGLGCRIAEGVEVRFEYQMNGKKDVEVENNVATLQFVVGY